MEIAATQPNKKMSQSEHVKTSTLIATTTLVIGILVTVLGFFNGRIREGERDIAQQASTISALNTTVAIQVPAIFKQLDEINKKIDTYFRK